MITVCDVALSLGGRPLRGARSTFFFIKAVLIERSVKSIDISVAASYRKTQRNVNTINQSIVDSIKPTSTAKGECNMSNQVRSYEPLTSQNAAVILVDHQIGLMSGVRDYSIGMLKHNVVALAKAAKALKLPIVVTTTARDSMWGPTIPELVEALPGMEIIDRSSVNAYDDARVARAIEATGRKKFIFAGLSLEVCAALPAMTRQQRVRRVRARGRMRNFQRHQAPSWDFANGSIRRSGFGLLHIDGGDSQGQSRARSGPRL
jgi:hypothetical protein